MGWIRLLLVEARPNVDMEFELLSMTNFANK